MSYTVFGLMPMAVNSVACKSGDVLDEPAGQEAAAAEPARIHALRRPHGQRRLLRIGQVHRLEFAAKEAGSW